jgi:hypothetical protein
MATKNVDAFFEQVATDRALQAKLKSLHQKTLKGAQAIKAAASADVVKIAAAAGFKFTARDLTGARGAVAKRPAKAELSEVGGQWMQCNNATYDYCTNQQWQCVGYSYY